jgi:cellobiose phosphorylase
MHTRNIALSFYQELTTANGVLEELKRQRFRRYAAIHRKKDGSLETWRYFPLQELLIPIFGLLLCWGLWIVRSFGLWDPSPIAFIATMGALVALSVMAAAWTYLTLIDTKTLQNYEKHVLVNETLVLVQVDQNNTREALRILQHVKSEYPISFLLRPDLAKTAQIEIPDEPLTSEQLAVLAQDLALAMPEVYTSNNCKPPLLSKLDKSRYVLQFLQRDIADAEFVEQTILSSAVWLLDNMYVIEGSIEDIKQNFPKKFYQELPKIASGPWKELPRIYALAVEIVKGTAGRLSGEKIQTFIDSYQQHSALTIGELWALPLMLRLRLIEWILYLAINLDNRMREGELANFWGNRLLNANRHDPDRLKLLLEELSHSQNHRSAHFAEELLDHLFDQETLLPTVRKWLEERFEQPLNEILHQEQVHETSEQIVFANSITSLITLSQLSWPDLFEKTSIVDAILRQDPLQAYSQMNFATRNTYREVIEEISRGSAYDETATAHEALQLAHGGQKTFDQHVGYYLVDAGRSVLEQRLQFRPTVMGAICRFIIAHANQIYFGAIFLIISLAEALIFSFLHWQQVGSYTALFFCLAALLPISEPIIQLADFLLMKILPAPMRPKMNFEKGLPEGNKTLVIVPMLLTSQESIKQDIEHLEIRYLANNDSHLYFGLFSDFKDAGEQHVEEDASLLQLAVNSIGNLESKYGPGKFFLFHRQRLWSQSEQCWIGWERKRGKLEILNRYLKGEKLPENILYAGQAPKLSNIRYVITLDADTQLPKGQARALVEILAHPLNQPYLDGSSRRLLRGYTIIQPRVVTDYSSAMASWLCRIFSDPAAIDPYSQAISNIYQDLFNAGSYHGKGIYDVDVFYRLLDRHFPEEHLLSHDLLEGAYVHTAWSSGVCLFDSHPLDYFSWAKRQLRWMRGDWQIVDWLLPNVPTAQGTEPNPLPLIERWKIFNNLRRALVPIALLSVLIGGWLLSATPDYWTALVIGILLMPALILLTSKLLTFSLVEITAAAGEFGLRILRAIVALAMLPFEAYLSLKALLLVMYRRLISHANLLQWEPSSTLPQSFLPRHSLFKFGWQLLFAICSLAAVTKFNPLALPLATAICLLWMSAPWIVLLLDRPIEKRPDDKLSEGQCTFLRQVARRTWRYFDDFVGPQTHWMPPDNYQSFLNIEIAQRTSPTNIGMWLVSLLGAYDLKYITMDLLIEKALSTMLEMRKLERYEGHFLNWYNIQTLEPLYPRYISTVDSGNLLASFWTLEQGLDEAVEAPLLPLDALEGLKDTYAILSLQGDSAASQQLKELLYPDAKASSLAEQILKVRMAIKCTQEAANSSDYWFKAIQQQLRSWESIISRYFSWVDILQELSSEDALHMAVNGAVWKAQALALNPSLHSLANGQVAIVLKELIGAAEQMQGAPEMQLWAKRLVEALGVSQWLAGEKIAQMNEVQSALQTFSNDTHLKYLYNNDRKLFATGYNVDEHKLDSSSYDLLASEARISSLVAMAKEDIPLDHWWALGRPYGMVQGTRVLMSWGGTMFEYLMPRIFTKQYSDSLLGQACEAMVACQIRYGRRRGIPWGISEAAFSAIDSHRIYQYRSFGIPGLGLKRGLENDLVVSPYSSALALAVNAPAAISNLQQMASNPHLKMMEEYGFYDSIDFTRQYSSKGERGVIVYTYMAHHQGMILASINNVLNGDILVRRFQRDPRISGIQGLLYERIPTSPPIKLRTARRSAHFARLKDFSQIPVMGILDTPESVTPRINLLSNGQYALMISNSGGGYSRWRDIDITRWRADTTRDAWGSYCYVKDCRSGATWSASYQPTELKGHSYAVNFRADKADFRRKDHNIEILTEMVVSPEDDAEIRLMTVINHSNEVRLLEITSYMELVLAAHLTDRVHPCFNKLFIETEILPESSALLAFRRLRSPDDQPIYAGHLLATNHPLEGSLQYETDRSRFIGRGRTLKSPLALKEKLSNTTGTVLDPIFSLRAGISLGAGKSVQLSFVTVISSERSTTEALIEKYKDPSSAHRAIELAWAFAQLELRHLRVQQEEVQLYQKLASRILFPHSQLRTTEERLCTNQLGQSELWPLGISGDLPIVAVTVGDVYDIDLVKQLLIAHAFWHLRGLKCDLIILNEENVGYDNPLNQELQNIINAHAYKGMIEVPGGIFLRSVEKISTEQLNLIFFVARALLFAARGSLRQQLVSPQQRRTYPPFLELRERRPDEPSKPLPFLELPCFNGLGGFSPDGSSYVIYLGPKSTTPAPWINVLANPQFGILVSEQGLGCCWYGNSQSNRLTPWSNDPVIDTISDVVYIRDEQLGTVWTVTPGPIREEDPYRITHSQGFSRFEHNSHNINQELIVFVPQNDGGGLPLRIQTVRMTNCSGYTRKLTLTAYSEWVLGGDREETQPYIITSWDSESQALFAINRYNSDFGSGIAFACVLTEVTSFSGDRTEFIGRNRSNAAPEALRRKGLSGHVGAALDPCSALQTAVEIPSNQTVEVTFILGFASDAAAARQLITQCRQENRIQEFLAETTAWWHKTINTIQVELPDLPTQFMINHWLPYQNLSCRFWGRAAFYQSSGAYGFRDQLQDSMAIVYALPQVAREHILKAASRQFVEGDVQHWWHPQTGGGVRTRFSDDLLWLPYVTAHYIRITGDLSILNVEVPFIEGPVLTDDQHEIYIQPQVSIEMAPLLEHCRRALHKGISSGPHGLPLIGSGDWNDGMNRVGIQGKGESVWLAWFLMQVMNDFADLLDYSNSLGSSVESSEWRHTAKQLAEIVETTAWDGEWYRRAYFDEGSPLGSNSCLEAKIDSLAQSWAVISGMGRPERCQQALQSALQHLVNRNENLVRLLTPPFDKTSLDPGYIKGYPPGVRENGGQYTHGSLWLAMALARCGEGSKAVELLNMMAPRMHTSNSEACALYRVEPYVIVADIYDLKGQVGRGGWSWYTGSAAWMYRIWLEEILGFKLQGQQLEIKCCLPAHWDGCKIHYRYRTATYSIAIANPEHISRGNARVTLDGVALASGLIPLVDDGNNHIVDVVIMSTPHEKS